MKHSLLKKYIGALVVILCCNAMTVSAQSIDKYDQWGPGDLKQAGWILRVGYVIGGTSPIPLPNEIRSINSFKPLGGLTFGADYYQMLSRRWGFAGGVHFFYEGFHTEATVKNYTMSIVQGGNYLDGVFTGVDETDTKMAGITIPLTAAFRATPRFSIGVGPFFSFVGNSSFEGTVYDGYLREGDPTGQKVEMTSDNPASYDFAADMNHFYWGLQFMFDYKLSRHINAFGALDWGMSSIFPKDFETVPFKMYPIYAKIGIGYRL